MSTRVSSSCASINGARISRIGSLAKKIVPNFFSDQARIWTFPVRLAEGRGWKPTLAVVGITGGLLVADPHVAGYFRTHNNLSTFKDVFSVTTTERVPANMAFIRRFTVMRGAAYSTDGGTEGW